MRRSLSMLALTLLLHSVVAGGAKASSLCETLANQLANITETTGTTARARKYAQAITTQKFNIRHLRQQMRASDCSVSLLIIGDGIAADCEDYEEKLRRMERNLEILNQKRLSLLSAETTGFERQGLLSALETNGCDSEPTMINAPAAKLAPDTISGNTETIRVPTSGPDYHDSQFVDLGGTAVNGSYRTMCVRACDGGYFPVSSHASSLNFSRDAQVCSMMCPGTETELYYHSIAQETTEMRSATTGKRYDELPNAYRFRTESKRESQQCGCNFTLYYKEMMKREAFIVNPDRKPENASAIIWAKPQLRGGLKAETTPEAKPNTKVVEKAYSADQHIRVIGPKFLPDNGKLDFAASATAEAP